MRALIILHADGSVDSVTVVNDDFKREHELELRKIVKEKGGRLTSMTVSSYDDFEWYIKDSVDLS